VDLSSTGQGPIAVYFQHSNKPLVSLKVQEFVGRPNSY
jgi:hypothetical protein